MIEAILGKKLGMTQVFAADGRWIPVTVVEAGPCTVLQKKTVATDGYDAFQIGFGAVKSHRVNKPMMGHFRKAGQGAFGRLTEVRTALIDAYQVGDQVVCGDVFTAGDIVDATGTSKGKGFQGVVRRWHFAGGPGGHGSMFHRLPGSIGCSAWPSRVFKGKRMGGQMGNRRTTIQNLEIVDVRPAQNLILVKGALPGPNNGVVLLRKGIKAKK